MLGAIAGDIIGSVYEFDNHRSTDFPLFTNDSHFTDDTILTVAVAECLMTGEDLVDAFHRCYELYPDAGWGGMFSTWASTKSKRPYGSFGNGSAMRVSPVAWAFESEQEVLEAAAWSARVTHDHPIGIAGAQATALAIWMGMQGPTKQEIIDEVTSRYGFRPTETVEQLRATNKFDETCQGTLPAALQIFLEAESFEHAIRLAVSIGGDTDTICCIVGSMAEAYYGSVPEGIKAEVWTRLDESLREVTICFRQRHELA